MMNNLVAVHTNAVIGNGQGKVIFIQRDADAQFAVAFIRSAHSARKRSLSAASEALEISWPGKFLYQNTESMIG
ncbi:hypothetical protein ACNKHO_02780 [Shigella flexneri]